MQINPLGRNWGTLVNWDDLGMAISTTTYILNHKLTRRRKIIRRPHYRLVGCSCRWHPLSNLAPKIAFRPDTQFEDRHHFYCLPTHLFGEDLARIHHKWPLPVQRRILDHEHLPAFRHCSFPGQRDPITKHRRTTRGVASAPIFIQWNASTFGSKLATSGVQSVCTTHSSTEKLLLYCGRHGDTGTLTAVLDQQGTEYTLTHLQLIITSVIYVTSPTLQGNWSSYGDIPYNKGQVKCRKTLEWIPSAFWQLFWTWIYGPYELFRIRNIRDAHRWRLQTILCIVSGYVSSHLLSTHVPS
jgi:hypothetical protein